MSIALMTIGIFPSVIALQFINITVYLLIVATNVLKTKAMRRAMDFTLLVAMVHAQAEHQKQIQEDAEVQPITTAVILVIIHINHAVILLQVKLGVLVAHILVVMDAAGTELVVLLVLNPMMEIIAALLQALAALQALAVPLVLVAPLAPVAPLALVVLQALAEYLAVPFLIVTAVEM